MTRERILITGGAGFLGNVMARHFLAQGNRVTVLDNLMYRQDHTMMPLAANPNFEFVYGDVRDKRVMNEQVSRAEVIVPLAAIVGASASEKRPFDTRSINQDSIELLDSLRSPSQKVIFPNTNSGYGTKTGQFNCNEETPLEPISLYGVTKCAAEDILLNSGKGAVVYRLASVFGVSPRMRLDLSFHDMVLQALTTRAIVMSEGSFTRNYVYIQDVVGGFQHAIDNYETMVGEAFNLGNDAANITRRGLADKVAAHLPGTIIYENESKADPDKRNYLVSNEKLRRAGYQAQTSIEHGIDEVTRGISIMLRNDPNRNI